MPGLATGCTPLSGVAGEQAVAFLLCGFGVRQTEV